MRRADRLFHIVQLMRRRRLTTAAQLAERLEVSERTIYRDVRDLVAAGIPITGEAGMGYRLSPHVDLPPLMFNAEEIEALVLGARMVETWGDDELRLAARRVLDKVEAVLPPRERGLLASTTLFSLSFRVSDAVKQNLGTVRRAVRQQQVVELDYGDERGERTARRIRPLGVFFWGTAWTVAAWCELRDDFRNFRLDRMVSCRATGDAFALEPPVTLEDYIRAANDEAARAVSEPDRSKSQPT
jgi:predicted DNA-binding transcriptional regulator YafY